MAIAAELLEYQERGQDGVTLLGHALYRCSPGTFAVLSSFGTDSAVLLALVVEIAPDTPVLFLDTGRHFPETLRYRDALAERLKLRDLRTVAPDPAAERERDPDRTLWFHDPDTCCRLRKVEPMDAALPGFGGLVTGRKRHQATTRAALPFVEERDGRLVLNPLADWDAPRLRREMLARDLPAHPLLRAGYTSVGCDTCTRPPADGADPRSGRWAGSPKTECGIHSARRAPARRSA